MPIPPVVTFAGLCADGGGLHQLTEFWTAAVAFMVAHLVNPVLAYTGLSGVVSDPTGMAELLLIGIAQIFVIGLIFLPFEKMTPAEQHDGRLTVVDRAHTFINLLGIVPFGTYLVLIPVSDAICRALGQDPASPEWHLGNLVPWLDKHPLILFMVYFVALDFAAWVMHRLQHKFAWWWALHSLHHSQRQMTRWSDDRGNIIDSVLQSLFVGAWGLFIGVAPVEYGLISFLGKMVENFSHTNTRFGFGPVLDKLLIDPRFHRQHHMMADPRNPDLHNCNFGFVFPVWDIIFGTALYDGVVRPTGLDDPEADADNNLNWWQQQVASTRRLLRALGVPVQPMVVQDLHQEFITAKNVDSAAQNPSTRDSAPVA